MARRGGPDILFLPPLGLMIALLAAFALGVWAPLGVLPPFPWMTGIVTGLLIGFLAVSIMLSGFLAFQREGTNVNPYFPALKVVRSGAFRFTRNPMYLGMILLVLAVGLFFSNLWGIPAAFLLWVAVHFGVVLREEDYMEKKFGDDYRALLHTTRRWF